MTNEDDSILDLKQIEDMMRASQVSNIFTSAAITDSAPRDSTVSQNFGSSAKAGGLAQ